jgi:hypothetical protein
MMVPTIHRNGTSRDGLMEPLKEALEALRKAGDAVVKTSPNGRDFYPQGNDALRDAQYEHLVRVTRLKVVYDELMELALAIQDAPGPDKK